MAHCVSKTSPEFKKLLAQSTMHPLELAARVSLWQEANGLDNFPEYSQILPEVDQEFLENLFPNDTKTNVDSVIENIKEEVSNPDENIENEIQDVEEAVEVQKEPKLLYSDKMKLKAMQDSMPNVVFIEDDTLNKSGVLLGTNSPEYKEYGVPVIKVNPNLLFPDTIIHEYGHLYIDLLGGMSNGRVKAAYKQLEGTKLAKEVAENNPELSGEMLQKEIVATAIGREGSDIFNTPGDISWWDKFIDWFFNLIKVKTFTDPNYARELASDLVYNKINAENLIGEQSTYDQNLKYVRPNKPKQEFTPNKKIESLADFNKKAAEKIDAKLTIYRNKYSAEEKTDQVEFLESLKDDLQNHAEGQEIEKAALFIEYANRIINNSRIQKYTTGNFATEELPKVIEKAIFENDPEAFQEIKEVKNLLNLLDSFLASFDIVNDLNKFLKTSQAEEYLDELNKLLPNLDRRLNSIIANKDAILKARIDVSREILSYEMGTKSSLAQSQYKNQLEQEWNKLNPKGFKSYTAEEKEARRAWVTKKIIEEQPNLVAANIEIMREKLSMDIDIWSLSAMLVSADNLNSQTIQLAKKLFDEQDFKARNESLETYQELADIFKKFNEANPSGNPLEKYKKLLEFKNGVPTGYLAGRYRSEFYEKYKEELSAERAAIELFFNNNSEAKAEYKEFQNKFKEANALRDAGALPAQINALVRQGKILEKAFYDKWYEIDPKFKAAKEKYINWRTANTKQVIDSETGKKTYIPNDSWVNKNFNYNSLTAIEKETWNKAIGLLREDDKKLPFNNRLVKRAFSNVYFAELPTASRSNLERAYSGVEDLIQENLQITKIRPEDTELREARVEETEAINDPHKAHKLVLGNEKEEAKIGLPIHYRGPKTKDQSYDLFTLLALNNAMSNNYAAKSEIKDSIELLLDVLADDSSKVRKVSGHLSEVFSSTKKYSTESRAMSNEYKALKAMVETRLYGIGMDDSKYNKLSSFIMKWSASTTFALNYFAGAANLAQGTAQNLIESLGGGTINFNEAHKRYINDSGTILQDIGAIKKVSLTNHLLGRLNILESFHGVHSKFINDTRLKNLLGSGASYFMSNAGEHYIHSTMMWGVMDNIKVTNANGEYLNSEGAVVKDKSKAMSLADAYYTENGKIKMKPVEYTTMSFNKFSEVELSNYIKHIGSQLHGQYDNNLKAAIQKHWAGSQAYMFRKWLVPGVLRRFRGVENILLSDEQMQEAEFDTQFFSEDLQKYEEGYYYTSLRYVMNVFKTKGDKLKAASLQWQNLNDEQRKNIHRTFIDAVVMAGTYISYAVLKNLSADADDKEKKFLLFGAFVARRLYAEQAFYRSPTEFFKLMRSPAASLSHFENLTKFVGQTMPSYDLKENEIYWKALDTYKTGNRKGESLLKYKLYKVSPFISQAVRTTEEALQYIE